MVTVSAKHADILKNYSLYLGKNYVLATPRPTGSVVSLHRLLYPDPVPRGMVIDHIDRNPYNNVVSNLRVVTCAFNSRNRAFRKGSNVYKGIQIHGKAYRAYFGTKRLGTFKTAREAKVHRIVHAMMHEDAETVALETDIEMSEDEADRAQAWLANVGPRKRNGPGEGTVFLTSNGKSWGVNLRRKYLGHYATKEEAEEVRRQAVEAHEKLERQQQDAIPIPRTPEGYAFLTAKTGENVLVDDDIYRLFESHVISIGEGGYAIAKNKQLHAQIVQKERGKVIDHKNRNRLDNRRSNLRITTYATNSRNRSARSASGYLGVLTLGVNKFAAVLRDTTVIPTKTHYKTFKTAKQASEWRVAQSRQLYPEDFI